MICSFRSHASAAVLAALLLAACSSSSGAPADASTAADAAPSDTSTTTDAGPADATPADDAGACADFTGGYALTGTCSVPGFSPFPTACITQTGCSAQVLLENGATTGSVTGNRLTFTSMVSGVPLSCSATRNGDGALAVRCEAAGGAASCDAVAAAPTFTGATRWCCNVAAQDCGAGQRCNIVGIGERNSTAITACIPAGAGAEGSACTRADGRLGADGCATQLTCVNFGQASPTMRTCQRTCRTTADCTAGESCIIVATTPRAGVCRPACTPLDSGSCQVGTCRFVDGTPSGDNPTAPLMRVTTCQPVGTTTEGQPCAGSNECAADLTCARRTPADAFACRRICSVGHPCPMGTTCSGVMSDTDPLGAGACLP